jgi:glycosyltransferase involved in cell wall biosynthesis
VKLSICIITLNEEANLPRTLESVKPLVADGQGEIIVVDSGSTDRTVEIAKGYGAKVFVEEWKGFAAQKNSAIDKAQGEWILSLDADEELGGGWVLVMSLILGPDEEELLPIAAFETPRRNYFLGRWVRHGGFYPDRKTRLFRKDKARFKNVAVHETVDVNGKTAGIHWWFEGSDLDLIHHAYPKLSGYIEHMNKYSSLGAEMAVAGGKNGFSFINIVVRPCLTFVYNYFLRLGFLDGKEGLLLHLYHSAYVSWKYAKVYELTRKKK